MPSRQQKIDELIKMIAEFVRIVGCLVMFGLWFWVILKDHGLDLTQILFIIGGGGAFCLLCFIFAWTIDRFSND